MPLAGLARRLWQKESTSCKETLVPQASMTAGQEEGVEVKADVLQTEARIEELEKQLAITRQELNQWRDISGQHVVKRLLDQLAERDREVVRLRNELEIAVGGPVESGVPPAVLLEWSQSGPLDEAQPSSLLQRHLPNEAGIIGQSIELPVAGERIGESQCGELQPQSSECEGSCQTGCPGSPASSERTLGPSGCHELPLPTKGNGANAGISNHQVQRMGSSDTSCGHPYSAGDAIDRDDVELRREGLEQWIEGGSSSDSPSHRSGAPAVSARAPPMSPAHAGDATSITSDDNQSAPRRVPETTDPGGADDAAGAGNNAHHANARRDITPRDLALRRDAVEQLQEEIHGEIAKHREASLEDARVSKHGTLLEGSGRGNGEQEVKRQPTGGSLVSCSFFVSAEDDDGRKEMRRRRFERNQFERRSRTGRERANSNSSIAEQKRDADVGGSAQSPSRLCTGSASNLAHLPLAHMPKTAPEEERSSPSRVGTNSAPRGAHLRLHTDRSRSPGQNSRHEVPEGGHRFGPPIRVAAANAAAYAAAAAASALAAVSVKQEQRASQASQRHRLPAQGGVLSMTAPPSAAAPSYSGATPPHATSARNRSSPRASPRPSPRPSRTSPLNSPRVEEGARWRASELNQGRTQSEAPPSRSTGGAASGSLVPASNVTTLRTKFTELRDEMKRRRGKEVGDIAEQDLEDSPSRQPLNRSTATAGEPRPELTAGEGTAAIASGSPEPSRQSRAAHLQPVLSRGGGNNSRSPRPGGSGLNTRGRARHMRDDGIGGGPGSFTGPTTAASPSASSSSGQHSGLTRCSSARRRIGGAVNNGRRAVPPISGLLNLRSSVHGGSAGSHTAKPGSHENSGDPERPAPAAPPASPAVGAVPERSGSLKAPLPGAPALAAAAVAAAAAAVGMTTPEASAAQKASEQKCCDSIESLERTGSASALPSSNSTGTLPSLPTATGAVAGNGSMAVLSAGAGGSLQVGINAAPAQLLRSARHRQHSPVVGTQSPKLAPHATTVIAAPVGATTVAHISAGGSSSSASAAKGHASPRDTLESDGDPVQEAVLQFTQHCGNVRQPLVRVSPGVYLHGQKKLQLTLKQGRLMVRIGGGLVSLSETLLNSLALGGSGSNGIAVAFPGSTIGSTVVQATPVAVGQVSTSFSATSGFMTPGGTATLSTPAATAVVAATGLQTLTHSSRHTNAIPSGTRTKVLFL